MATEVWFRLFSDQDAKSGEFLDDGKVLCTGTDQDNAWDLILPRTGPKPPRT